MHGGAVAGDIAGSFVSGTIKGYVMPDPTHPGTITVVWLATSNWQAGAANLAKGYCGLATTTDGGFVRDDPVTPADLTATVLHHLGIDPAQQYEEGG